MHGSSYFPPCLAATACVLLVSTLSAQVSSNMTLESHIPLPPCAATDVWAMGDYMLLARQSQGFAVIDIRDPRNPVMNTIRPPGYPTLPGSLGVGDIKSDGRYIYATDESTAQGIFIYDSVPDPMNPTLVSTLAATGRAAFVHNCWVDGNHLYAGNKVFDVSDKTRPRYLTKIGPYNFTHDIVVLDNRAYLSNLRDGIAIYDVTNPRVPVLVATKNYVGAYTHNMWPSEDRNYLFTTDEIIIEGVGGYVRVWDISSLPAMTQVGSFKTGPVGSVVHNVHVRGDLLFISYFKEGLRVCSIEDPTRPVEIAYYDTFTSPTGGCHGALTAGCWGVYPWRRDVVLVGDIDTGAYILRLNPIGQDFRARSPTTAPGGTIDLDFLYRNDASAPLDAFGVMLLSSINGVAVPWFLVVDAKTLIPGQSVPHTTAIGVPVGLPTPLTLGFTGYSGITGPLIISEQRDVTVTIR